MTQKLVKSDSRGKSHFFQKKEYFPSAEPSDAIQRVLVVGGRHDRRHGVQWDLPCTAGRLRVGCHVTKVGGDLTEFGNKVEPGEHAWWHEGSMTEVLYSCTYIRPKIRLRFFFSQALAFEHAVGLIHPESR